MSQEVLGALLHAVKLFFPLGGFQHLGIQWAIHPLVNDVVASVASKQTMVIIQTDSRDLGISLDLVHCDGMQILQLNVGYQIWLESDAELPSLFELDATYFNGLDNGDV